MLLGKVLGLKRLWRLSKAIRGFHVSSATLMKVAMALGVALLVP